ncbi:MAG: Tex family protein [Aquabacterium sp.]
MPTALSDRIVNTIAREIRATAHQVMAAVDLLDGGATVPFIARYRKEITGALDDIQLRDLESRLSYLRELELRRAAVLKSIEEQGRLTPDLASAIDTAETKQVLEDLYLPYKPRRRTKGMAAREAGLEPLAARLLADPGLDPNAQAVDFINADAGYADVAAVLDGVRDLLAERWAEDAGLVGSLREWLWQTAQLRSVLAGGQDAKAPDAARLLDYHDYAEPIQRVPSHRALAVLRGRTQGLLDVAVQQEGDIVAGQPTPAEGRIAAHLGLRLAQRPADVLLRRCVAWTWKVKLSLSLERDLLARLREAAEAVAIRVFASNLRDLLLAAPAGSRVVMGLDPGIRTGVKVAVVSDTGRVLATETVHPHEPRRDWDGAAHRLEQLCRAHGVALIATGNGTASRETDRLAAAVAQRLNASPDAARRIEHLVISEAGASVYSASEVASRELPQLDVSLRGAVSIARRVQDPLAELVKIDPKSIGVGQYQHDVDQAELARTLGAVVEDCVNHVGVDLNTASPPLLARVAGLSAGLAERLVQWRDAHGRFANRQQLLQVHGLGPRSFEQAAGFLRIRDGDNPLDSTAVHPESYGVVQALLARLRQPLSEVMGRPGALQGVDAAALAAAGAGQATGRDLLAELAKPGRDPRPDFQVARFNDGVESLTDLLPGMILQGTVSNVAAFGAFVDLGVHQDGLVHVSEMADRFVKDAHDVVKAGDIVQVRVVEVDVARKRIALSLRLKPRPGADRPNREAGEGLAVRPAHRSDGRTPPAAPRGPARATDAQPGNALADAFARARRER